MPCLRSSLERRSNSKTPKRTEFMGRVDCFMSLTVETHVSIALAVAVVKEAGLLSALLSGSFSSRQHVMNKCFRCDAIGLAMLEAAAAQCSSCWGRPHKAGKSGTRTNCRGFEQRVFATKMDVFVYGTCAWQIRRMR
jgi:hypothetical protein